MICPFCKQECNVIENTLQPMLINHYKSVKGHWEMPDVCPGSYAIITDLINDQSETN